MQTLRKTIAFPIITIRKAEEKGRNIGMDFTDYIRYLLAKDIEEFERIPSKPVYYMSDATEKAVIEGENEYAEGKTMSFKDGTSFFKYLRSKRKK